MQAIWLLMQSLAQLANPEQSIFTLQDLRALLPEMSTNAFKTLLSRAVKEKLMDRICRGLYQRKQCPSDGLLLFHAAARLRADHLNYISLETALSEAGIISQIPINRITLMSSGRSSVISCGRWGTIEFVHTTQKAEELVPDLNYDSRCKLWRASVQLALRDMRVAHRNLDLVDWSVVHELI